MRSARLQPQLLLHWLWIGTTTFQVCVRRDEEQSPREEEGSVSDEDVQEVPVTDASLGSSKPKFQFSIEEVEISDDEETQLTEQELDNFIQQNNPTPEQGENVNEIVQQDALNPPQSVSVATNELAESELEDSAYALLPRKRKRRYPRPGVLISDLVQKPSKPTETTLVVKP